MSNTCEHWSFTQLLYVPSKWLHAENAPDLVYRGQFQTSASTSSCLLIFVRFGFAVAIVPIVLVEVVEFSDFVILNDAAETTSAQLIHDVERVGFCQVACGAWLVLLDEGTHLGVPLVLQSDAPLMVALQ